MITGSSLYLHRLADLLLDEKGIGSITVSNTTNSGDQVYINEPYAYIGGLQKNNVCLMLMHYNLLKT
jgi:hypothetical protein